MEKYIFILAIIFIQTLPSNSFAQRIFYPDIETHKIREYEYFDIEDTLSENEIVKRITTCLKNFNWEKRKDTDFTLLESNDNFIINKNTTISFKIQISFKGESLYLDILLSDFKVNGEDLEKYINHITKQRELRIWEKTRNYIYALKTSLMEPLAPTHKFSRAFFNEIKTIKAFAFNIDSNDTIHYNYKYLHWDNGSIMKILTEKQRRQFLKVLSNPLTYGTSMSACYIPHHTFMFYDNKGTEIGIFEICFMCDGAYISIDNKEYFFEFHNAIYGKSFDTLVRIARQLKLKGEYHTIKQLTKIEKKEAKGTQN